MCVVCVSVHHTSLEHDVEVGGALIVLRYAIKKPCDPQESTCRLRNHDMSRRMASHVQGEQGANYSDSSTLLDGKKEGQNDLGSSWSTIHHSKREEHSTR